MTDYKKLSHKQIKRKMAKHDNAFDIPSYHRDAKLMANPVLATFNEIHFHVPSFGSMTRQVHFYDCFFNLTQMTDLLLGRGTLYMNNCVFTDCYFDEGMKFSNTNFENCVFNDCAFDKCRFNGATFNDCRFDTCHLSGSNWWDARINGTHFAMRETRIDYNLFVLGHDSRNYTYWMAANPENVMTIYAGCHRHVGITSAQDHWDYREYYYQYTKPFILSMLDTAKRIAPILGWKLDPDPEPTDDEIKAENEEYERLRRTVSDTDIAESDEALYDDEPLEFMPLPLDENGDLAF